MQNGVNAQRRIGLEEAHDYEIEGIQGPGDRKGQEGLPRHLVGVPQGKSAGVDFVVDEFGDGMKVAIGVGLNQGSVDIRGIELNAVEPEDGGQEPHCQDPQDRQCTRRPSLSSRLEG